MLTTTKYRKRLCPPGRGAFFSCRIRSAGRAPVAKTGCRRFESCIRWPLSKKGYALERKASGLTQRELAEKLGVITGTIGYYERGAGQPKTDNLFALCDILHIRPADLLRADP